ncbi:peptide deformylase [Salipiger sp. IMCC34102]|uniref:peptide deformylase n=1 Tax=Salipiger sp. IMCC34102 TaxID=2510647 RepID=UPI00101BBE91|nr:peptide deformylase [Salipiger sp. IMCC34102]RYH01643.1 peptide deformylase [Salipiger sp. IMCC34102]
MRQILTVPHPDLRAVCADVEGFGADLSALADEMFEAMYAANGRGLAAPQVGVLQRLFVMDAGWKDGASERVVMVNPVVASASPERVTRDEVCLSIPDRVTPVSRPAIVHLRYQDLRGLPQEVTLEGPAATIAQHERDHLDGILCTDHAGAA